MQFHKFSVLGQGGQTGRSDAARPQELHLGQFGTTLREGDYGLVVHVGGGLQPGDFLEARQTAQRGDARGGHVALVVAVIENIQDFQFRAAPGDGFQESVVEPVGYVDAYPP